MRATRRRSPGLKPYAVTLVARVVAKVVVRAGSEEHADHVARQAALIQPANLGQADVVEVEFTEVLPTHKQAWPMADEDYHVTELQVEMCISATG